MSGKVNTTCLSDDLYRWYRRSFVRFFKEAKFFLICLLLTGIFSILAIITYRAGYPYDLFLSWFEVLAGLSFFITLFSCFFIDDERFVVPALVIFCVLLVVIIASGFIQMEDTFLSVMIALSAALIIAMIVFGAVMYHNNEAIWALVSFVFCLLALGTIITVLCFHYPDFKSMMLWIMQHIYAVIVGGIVLLMVLGAGKN